MEGLHIVSKGQSATRVDTKCDICCAPLFQVRSKHCLLIGHDFFFAAKFISSLLSSQQDASGSHYNYLDLACEVKPVCLLCGGCSLCLEHRMCVGVVGSETGWKGMFMRATLLFVPIGWMGSGEHIGNLHWKMSKQITL